MPIKTESFIDLKSGNILVDEMEKRREQSPDCFGWNPCGRVTRGTAASPDKNIVSTVAGLPGELMN